MGAFDVAAFRASKPKASFIPFGGPVPAYVRQHEGNVLSGCQTQAADAEKIVSGCAAVRWAVENQANTPETYWRDTSIGVGKFVGEETCHDWSREHPNYSPEETQAKADGWKGTGATLCKTLETHNPQACAGCQHRGRINSPISLGYTEKKNEPLAHNERILTLERGRVQPLCESPRRKFVVNNLLPAATVSTLGGLGGYGKTAISYSIGIALAAGKSWCGNRVEQGGVIILCGEEDPREVSARVNAACHGMAEVEKEKTLRNILAFGLMEDDARMVTTIDRQATATFMVQEVIDLANEFSACIGKPISLIVADHARVFASVDLNDGNAAGTLMRGLSRIASITGACVLLIAHSPKSSIGRKGEEPTAQDISGSSAMVDMARSAARVRGMNEDEAKFFGLDSVGRKEYVAFEMFKANYSALADILWFHKVYDPQHDTIRVEHVYMTPPPPEVKARKANTELDARIMYLIRERPGQLWLNRLLERHAGKSKTLKASAAEVEAAISRLRADGRLILREPTQQERADNAIHHTVKAVFQSVTND